ncbi:MAG TPA: ABC transporter ATP-binding protein [Vicinamibacteria bacterium]|nr:ABC transporter ATP-binding protein [Vicinamibacteria bacterium]
MEPEPLIHTDDLSKRYPMGGGELLALKNVTLAIAKGEFAGLVGPSGSGKTTLLNIVGSLDVPSEGSATVLGRRIETLTHEAAAELRSRHIGFIFQTFNLLPVYTVYENVEFPLLLLGTPAAERRRAVMEALDRVHLADRASSRPAQLSGGQSQRVAIARAIVKQPALVLADEPTANLDAENSTNVIRIMDELNRDLGATFLFSTHDDKVIRWLRRRISLADGAVVGDEAQARPAGGTGAP